MNKSLIGGKEMIKSNNINLMVSVLDESSVKKGSIKKSKIKTSNHFKTVTPSPNELLNLNKKMK